MQGIYTYIPETNYDPSEYSVVAILLLQFMVLISLVSVLNLLYFYISTFRSMCAVPNMAVFNSSFTSWLLLLLLMLLLLLSSSSSSTSSLLLLLTTSELCLTSHKTEVFKHGIKFSGKTYVVIL